MKKQYFAILLATFLLAACGPRPTARYNRNLDEPMYYSYNPEDTIGNEPYWLLLRIDSARVDYRLDHPVSEMPMIDLDSADGMKKSPEQQGAFKMLDEIIMKETYGIGFKKGNDALAVEVWAAYVEMLADGTVDKIAAEYKIDGVIR